jgi:hypothetical protein
MAVWETLMVSIGLGFGSIAVTILLVWLLRRVIGGKEGSKRHDENSRSLKEEEEADPAPLEEPPKDHQARELDNIPISQPSKWILDREVDRARWI